MWHVYILKTQSGKFYTGVTNSLKRRFQEHRSGKGGHYTKYDRPQEFVFSEPWDNQQKAEQREQQIKRWTKAKKMALIQRDTRQLKKLSISRD